MDIEKLIQTTGYVLKKYNGVLNYTKLIKILYLSDRRAMEKTGYSITGDAYVSMKDGPVLSGLYDLIKNRFSDRLTQFYWNSKFQTDGYNIHTATSYIPDGKLTDFEVSVLDKTDREFHSSSYSQMIDYVHDKKNCPEWTSTMSSLPLSENDIFRVLGFSDDEIKYIEEEKESYRKEAELLAALDTDIPAAEQNKAGELCNA